MDDKEREKRFRRERRAQLGRMVLIQTQTMQEILHYLRLARDEILGRLAGTPTEFETWRLQQLQGEVRRVLETFERGTLDALTTGLDRSWEAGGDLVMKPLAAGGIDLAGQIPALDVRLLTALKSFQTDRIRDISTTTINRVNQEIGQAALGVQAPFEAAKKVSAIMDTPAARARMIVVTELGTAYSEAGQQRMEQAKTLGVAGLQKQWRRSGKLHPRVSHAVADGQIVDVDKPFMVGGIPIPKPRDPSIPVGERVYCGCSSLPHMKHWRVSTPGAKPFTAQELAASPEARQAERIRAPAPPEPAPAPAPPPPPQARAFPSPIEQHHTLTREYAGWVSSLTQAERYALNFYKGPGGYLVNEAMRRGVEAPLVAAQIPRLDEAIARASVPAPTRAWRGVDQASRYLDMRPGDVSEPDPAFWSATISREMAEGSAPEGVLLEFVLPAGYPAAYINGVPFPVGDAALPDSEFEMLLPRGRRFRVLERRGRRLLVEMLP
ncbi:ADP-ribosyltransferase [Aquabacter cavernae]|uniref:ADP-ribosyltransferase n=1 Tax=Aquabacter cavernae TaxID=2496029 RepID=UPI0013E043D6|nr:ADP-ribosyltransferase [Aquabacter cavernae]